MTHRLKGMRALRGLKKEVANSSKGIDIMRDEELDRTMKSSLEYLARLKQEQSMRLSQLVNRASTPQRPNAHDSTACLRSTPPSATVYAP